MGAPLDGRNEATLRCSAGESARPHHPKHSFAHAQVSLTCVHLSFLTPQFSLFDPVRACAESHQEKQTPRYNDQRRCEIYPRWLLALRRRDGR
jgi:hypothetical protein